MDIQKEAERFYPDKIVTCARGNRFNSGSIQRKAFIEGANHQRNAVWHDANKEQPPKGKADIVYINKDGSVGSAQVKYLKEDWEWNLKFTGIVAWCYQSDILPTNKKE